jgi:hypothetical protein
MFANDQFTVTGGKGTVLISGNGEKWSAVKSGSTDSLVGIARGDGKSVIVTYEGRLLDAHDANDWCPVDSTNCAAGLFDVAAAAGRLIAVGGGGAVLMSMDGRNWRSSPTHSKETLWGVAADNEYILAVGARGRILVTFAAADPRLTDKAVSGVGGTSADLKSAIAQALPIAKARFPRDGGVLTPGAVAAPVVAISTRPREGGSPIPSVNVPPTGAVPTSPREPARVEAQTQPASSAGPVLVLSKKNASPGETVAVRVTGFSSPTKESWIGLFKARSADKDYVTYGFVNNLLREVYDVTAPDEPGAYNFRLFKDSGYTPIAVSETLEVK